MKKNPQCPKCNHLKTQKRGKRRGKIRYRCQKCDAWFQINRKKKLDTKLLMKLHLEGLSFRSLANQFEISVGSAYNYVKKELEKLPHCADVTREYCQKFSGILEVDGKFLHVKKYDRQIPVLYGIDYESHDIPHFILSRSESFQTCKKFFSSINLMNYPLQALVSDDNRNIYETARYIYPNITVQICHVHYVRNIRFLLNLRERLTHRVFFTKVRDLFFIKRSPTDFDNRARKLLLEFQSDPLCVEILLNIELRKTDLLGYLSRKRLRSQTISLNLLILILRRDW